MHGMKRGGGRGGGYGGSQQKRPRPDGDEEDTPGSFEEHLANLMEEEETEYDDSPRMEGEGPKQESTYDRLGHFALCKNRNVHIYQPLRFLWPFLLFQLGLNRPACDFSQCWKSFHFLSISIPNTQLFKRTLFSFKNG